MSAYKIIDGTKFTDGRGKLSFFNAFDMSEIVRFYEIVPNDTQTVRAWQGHKREKKWFHCNSGSFMVNLVQLDNFENPSKNCAREKILLDSENPTVLEVPGGYANGFKSIKEDSKMLVFSNFTLEDSKADDFRFPTHKWTFENY